jgi:para-aminobenzoate synthetase component 1
MMPLDKESVFQYAAATHGPVVLLDACGHQGSPMHRFHWLAAWGKKQECCLRPGHPEDLRQLTLGKWWFGYAGYDLILPPQGEIGKADGGYFFEPEFLVYEDENGVCIAGAELDVKTFKKARNPEKWHQGQFVLQPDYAENPYKERVLQLKEHIQQGDFYEINFCNRFVISGTPLPMFPFWRTLVARNPMPFSCFVQTEALELACASPERFFWTRQRTLVSQPMKGTARRTPDQPEADALRALQLQQSEKERAENVMIVDLVRNDLSQMAERDTVKVEQLFHVQTFPHVHQMISTISCTLKPDFGLQQLFEALFPMGSMTGAPKRSAMWHIFQAEGRHRRAFSGTAGYVDPEGNMDFNVLIRTVLKYKHENPEVWVGSALTSDCDATQEWHECLLKIAPIAEVLGAQIPLAP